MRLSEPRLTLGPAALAERGVLDRVAPVFPWVLLGYFVLHVILRVAISPAVDLDEAEQILLTQDLRLGYGSQPPLYTWLQIAVFRITGDGILGLALLKNLLLFTTYLAIWLALRRISGDERTAVLGSLSLLLLPQVAWDAQRDLSHSVLVITACAVAFLAFVRLVQDQRTRDYLLFGLALGLGLVAKYNFTLLLVALLAAALLDPTMRAVLMDRRTGLTAAALALVVAGPLLWAAGNEDVATGSSWKLFKDDGTEILGLEIGGVLDLLRGCADVAGLQALIILGWLYRRRPSPGSVRPPHQHQEGVGAWRRLLRTTLILGLGVTALGAMAFDVSHLSERWLLPLFILFGPLLILEVAGARWCRRADGLTLTASACAVFVLLLVVGRVVAGPALGDPTRLNVPVKELAAQVRTLGFTAGTIASNKQYVAADLKLVLPESVAVFTDKAYLAPSALPACWLLVFDATEEEGLPDSLSDLYRERTGRSPGASAPLTVSAPLRFGDGSTPFRLGVVIPDRSACRDG